MYIPGSYLYFCEHWLFSNEVFAVGSCYVGLAYASKNPSSQTSGKWEYQSLIMKSIIVLHVQTLNDISDIVLIMKIDLLTKVKGVMKQASYQQIE